MTGDVHPLVRTILEGRGFAAEDLEAYFNPTLARLEAAEALPGVAEASEVILAALEARRRVVIFGDYDCDGVCATAIALRAVNAIAAAVGAPLAEPFIPHRLKEGYGMGEASVARMLGEVPDVGLVVTVDNGINSLAQVAELKARGIAVVVTDHHLPSRKPNDDGTAGGEIDLPLADAVVDPKVAAPEALEGLCGAGVAFMLANHLVKSAKARGLYAGPRIAEPLLVMAGLATVTDIMPLVKTNRILVSEALRRFGHPERFGAGEDERGAPVGLKELLLKAGRTGARQLTSRDFGFALGPRINAAGRIDSGMEALELVMTDDRDIARELARIVDGYNVQRKTIEQKMSDEALSKVVPGAAAQVIDLPDGHPGVAGIVAARVLEKIGLDGGRVGPVCVITGGHGSARAPDGMNVRDAMEACKEVLTSYGGHAAAGGLSVAEGRVDDFRRMLCAYCETHAPKAVATERRVEAWVKPEDLTLELGEWVARMEPFGEENAEPVFGLRGVTFGDVRTLGLEGRHLSLLVREAGMKAIRWNAGDQVERMRAEAVQQHDIQFTLEVSDYNERHVEMRLVDCRLSKAT